MTAARSRRERIRGPSGRHLADGCPDACYGCDRPAAVPGRLRAQPWWVAAAPVVATGAGHLLPGVRGGWELFGAGPGVLIRIQWARAG